MKTDVAITSFGCASPIGLDLAETAESLRLGRAAVSPVTRFPVTRFHSSTAGQIDGRLEERAAAISPRSPEWGRAAQMVVIAMEEALTKRPDFVPDCVIVGTTSGGMEFGELLYRAIEKTAPLSHAARWVREYVPHRPVLDAMGVFGFAAPVQIISTACASGTNALGMGLRLIRSGAAKRVLVGGYDALTEFVFAGFDALKASTPEICRPFDAARTGLSLGEGAAFFCLEAEPAGAPVAWFTGYGSSTDTHHLTQPHPSGSGPLEAMRRALKSAGMPAAEIGYINAHGTGTPHNDASEARAITELFPNTPVSSTKAMTGHALGAAGAIEAAFSLVALNDGFLPPNCNFQTPDPGISLNIVANTSRPAELRHVMSNSFGFGGANAAAIFSRP